MNEGRSGDGRCGAATCARGPGVLARILGGLGSAWWGPRPRRVPTVPSGRRGRFVVEWCEELGIIQSAKTRPRLPPLRDDIALSPAAQGRGIGPEAIDCWPVLIVNRTTVRYRHRRRERNASAHTKSRLPPAGMRNTNAASTAPGRRDADGQDCGESRCNALGAGHPFRVADHRAGRTKRELWMASRKTGRRSGFESGARTPRLVNANDGEPHPGGRT